MLAFDFYLNGNKIRTAGMNEPGVVATHVTWVRSVAKKKVKNAPEGLSLHVGGLRSRTNTHVTWLARQLVVGDTLRIDVIEVTKVDCPKKQKAESVQSRRQREQDYVKKKAASWGWKIQT